MRGGGSIIAANIAFAVCATLALMGCARQSIQEQGYTDMVVQGQWPTPPSPRLGYDELLFSALLRNNQSGTLEVELTENAKLKLKACAYPPNPGSSLVVNVTQDGQARISSTIGLDDQRWTQKTIDLSHLSRGTYQVSVTGVCPEQATISIARAVLSTRAPAPPVEPVADGRGQFLLISVDTLRADAIGGLGGWIETPNLDRFIDDAQVWPCIAADHWTKPSHASMLTGVRPSVHRLVKVDRGQLPPEIPTLAERFAEAGIATEALVFDCAHLSGRFGFARGFDHYRVRNWTLPQMADAVVTWINRNHDQPFFYFWHTFEVHSDFSFLPYESPGVTRRDRVARGLPRNGKAASAFLLGLNDGSVPTRETDVKNLKNLYAGGVRHLDHELGRLFEALRARGVYDQMTIVLTADHGESFLEHGTVLHENYWREVARVPLIIKWPAGKYAGQRETVMTTGPDIAATIAHLAGVNTSGMQGCSVLERQPGGLILAGREPNLVLQGDFKYFRNPSQDGRDYFFNIAEDPRELDDARDRHPSVFAAMKRELNQARRKDRQRHQALAKQGESDKTRLTQEELDLLKSLGYTQ